MEKISQKEINQLAKEIYKLNMLLSNAIFETERLINGNDFSKYEGNNLERLAKAYKKIDKNNFDFADIELNGAYFQDLNSFTQTLAEAIENL